MVKTSRDGGGAMVPPRALRPGTSGGWLAGAARALGLAAAPETDGGGRGFDFVALRRSLDSLERKTSEAGE